MKNLTVNQVNELTKNSLTVELSTYKPGEHYSIALGRLTFMPTTKAQAIRHISHIKNKGFHNLLMCGEWNSVEVFLNKHGFKGSYNLTKSGTMCRLDNMTSDYVSALKKEFNL